MEKGEAQVVFLNETKVQRRLHEETNRWANSWEVIGKEKDLIPLEKTAWKVWVTAPQRRTTKENGARQVVRNRKCAFTGQLSAFMRELMQPTQQEANGRSTHSASLCLPGRSLSPELGTRRTHWKNSKRLKYRRKHLSVTLYLIYSYTFKRWRSDWRGMKYL